MGESPFMAMFMENYGENNGKITPFYPFFYGKSQHFTKKRWKDPPLFHANTHYFDWAMVSSSQTVNVITRLGRWFAELHSMVDLSMVNCECHNQVGYFLWTIKD